MASPFPGMDPFMEEPEIWPNVHNRLIIYLADTLNVLMPSQYVANVEERAVLTDPPSERYPDIHVVKESRKKGRTVESSGRVAVLEPDPSVEVEFEVEEVRETFVEIRQGKEPGALITVLEIFSPTNKRSGSGREKYLKKQRELLNQPTHFIEIDLLRAGQHTLAIPRDRLPIEGWDYLICLHRAEWKKKYQYWPIELAVRLPRFVVPLANGDKDVVVDMQSMLAYCYKAGRFAQKIDYGGDCPPPLSEKNAKWIDALLRKKKLR